MATKKKWVKPVLIIGGIAVVAFFGLPVLMNYIRPGGTVNPTLPMSTPKLATFAPLGRIW